MTVCPLTQYCDAHVCVALSPRLSSCSEAQKLAQQFSNTEFISKILPESGLLDALKKVVPMALKMVV